MGSFISVAGLIMMMGAPFVAISQILIYIGGILILIVFGVFLTNKDQEVSGKISFRTLIRLSVSLVIILGIYYFQVYQWPINHENLFVKEHVQSTSALGFQLLTYAALPLQLIALLLLFVLVAATWYGSFYQKEENGQF